MQTHVSTIDKSTDEARRTAGLVLLAMLDRDNQAAADLIRTCDNPRDAWLATAALANALLDGNNEPVALLRAFMEADIGTMSPTARAREFLRTHLADGKRHPYRRLRVIWRAENLGTKDQHKIDKDLNNAARQLGVRYGNVGTADHWYQLPAKPQP